MIGVTPLLALASVLGIAAPAAATHPDLLVDLPGWNIGTVLSGQLSSTGSAPVRVRPRDRSGSLTWGREGDRANYAHLPVTTRAVGPQGVLEVDADGRDRLLPWRRPFTMSVDVRLAAGTRGTAADRGNNLLQRGTWGSAGQYKLQVDGGVASCRVAGSRGAVMVQDTAAAPRGSWARVACRVDRPSSDRDRARLTLTVTDLRTGARRARTSGTATIGRVAPRSEPLTVGGRLPSSGGNDQLEGDVDRVVVDIG